ncbi:argininosuccinate synthase [Candidatus Woesearchaeota archaeon]|nr:argininosuccinate synthase [Candidatus Woesearchaeota archaeon]
MKTATYEAEKGKVKKVILLYSGGLDTSVMVKWIQEEYGAEVITLTADLGQPGIDLPAAKAKALKLGASKAYIIDAKDEFAEKYIAKAIKANALYQGGYPLSTALGRPLIAKLAVKLAHQEGADAIAHGSTGKGNDQVRFDSSILAIDPDMKILAPVREWNMTRDKELEYAQQHGIEVPEGNKIYSTDENLWGKSSECGILEHPEEAPPDEVFTFVTPPEKAPDKSQTITIGFTMGVPTSLDGKKFPLAQLIQELNTIGAKHGIGILDHMEDRIVGLKSREVYECPAAMTIIAAHKDLEKYVSTIHQNHFKAELDNKWGYFVYAALWYDPVMADMNAYIASMNKAVTGWVKVKLYKGHVQVIGRQSDNALYDLQLASYNEGHTFNQAASPGFIELWSLQMKVINQIKNKKGVTNEALATGKHGQPQTS